jgi:hypothetical protein
MRFYIMDLRVTVIRAVRKKHCLRSESIVWKLELGGVRQPNFGYPTPLDIKSNFEHARPSNIKSLT